MQKESSMFRMSFKLKGKTQTKKYVIKNAVMENKQDAECR